MIVRIFLPDVLYSLKSIDLSKYHWICGKIECNEDQNVSIFIVDTKETGCNVNLIQQQQAIGRISSATEIQKERLFDGDLIEFSVCDRSNSKTDEESKLHLKTLHLPTFIAAGQSFHIQMFLYSSKTFTDLAQRIDESTWNQRPDAIAQLLLLIKNNEQQKHLANNSESTKKCPSSSQTSSSKQNRLFTFLLTVSAFIQSKMSFMNSAFVRHFHFWTVNLMRLTENGWVDDSQLNAKSANFFYKFPIYLVSVHIWTIFLDVMAGIAVMFWLWHIPNAGDYLIDLAMVIIFNTKGNIIWPDFLIIISLIRTHFI